MKNRALITGTIVTAVIAAASVTISALLISPKPTQNIFPVRYKVYVAKESSVSTYDVYDANKIDKNTVILTMPSGHVITIEHASAIDIFEEDGKT